MNRLESLAKLAVYKGVNVQEGQILVVKCPIEAYEFGRLVCKYAYEKGAKDVIFNYTDAINQKTKFENAKLDDICDIYDYTIERQKFFVESGACFLSISSELPGLMKDVNPEILQSYGIAMSKAMKPFRYYTMSNYGQWCVIAYPNKIWAKKVFPNLSEDDAYDKLLEAILDATRVDDNAVENWNKHNAEIAKHTEILNNYNFKTLHFKSELKTDLYVDLAINHIWEGGEDLTRETKVKFNPNMPTEEVFTMPKRDGVNGIVYASKPLSYQGNLIENFYLKFENGRVVDFNAESGYDALKNLLDTDEGSKYLGEVALLSYDSPISNASILFYNTLFDENASCHLALGACYPTNIKNGTDMSEDELKAAGGNISMSHSDFMFGTEKMSVMGITFDDQEVVIFENGNFVI